MLRERLYPEICRYLPDVGIVGGGKRSKGHRVMLYTFDSLHHSDGKADLLLCDEVHQAANSYFGLLRQASHSHADRAELANAVRRRGHCVNAALTKTYRKRTAA